MVCLDGLCLNSPWLHVDLRESRAPGYLDMILLVDHLLERDWEPAGYIGTERGAR